MKAIIKDVVFDDIEHNEEVNEYWSRICDNCLSKHPILEDTQDIDPNGSGSCGIEGCRNEADHYIDFTKKDVKII